MAADVRLQHLLAIRRFPQPSGRRFSFHHLRFLYDLDWPMLVNMTREKNYCQRCFLEKMHHLQLSWPLCLLSLLQ